ncbi:hypothetical protein GCM10007916_34040 [Psychromonas marina]|uniref:diguanylate cyclase n=1 Tax=Psychromonas marina TaxID=88364 RepID=A0ABQ6E580_9GAMM|nr:GGDEF domain-containing protein [Psychromonas marina]GLS92333.1 hypothetical protein GCM10007916_34040 [Psychromonas marina]
MKNKPDFKKFMNILNSFEDQGSMDEYAVLFSSEDNELVVFFVEVTDICQLIGVSTLEQKIVELNDFIHEEDHYLCQYTYLSGRQAIQTAFNLRIIKSDKSVIVVWIELEEVYCNTKQKTIAYKVKMINPRENLNKQVLDKAASNNYLSILSSAQDFVYFKNLNHIFTGSSQAMANITGFSSGEQHIGLTDYDIFPKEHADIYYRLENEILSGKKNDIKQIEPFLDENGNEGWVDTRKFAIRDTQGDIVGLFGISRDITEELLLKKQLEETQQKLLTLANQDGLTSMFTRRHGYDLSTQALTQANRYHSPLSLIMFDIDHFKVVNDNYGHECGDKVLVSIADIVLATLRDADIAFRYGGEEFVICSPHTSLQNTVVIMERINEKINAIAPPCKIPSVTVSAGIVELANDESLDKLIHRADELLYKAKAAGRNCIKY